MGMERTSMGFVISQNQNQNVSQPLAVKSQNTTAICFVNAVKSVEGAVVTDSIPCVSLAVTPYQYDKGPSGAEAALKKRISFRKISDKNKEILFENTKKVNDNLLDFFEKMKNFPGIVCGQLKFWDPETGEEIESLDINIRPNKEKSEKLIRRL